MNKTSKRQNVKTSTAVPFRRDPQGSAATANNSCTVLVLMGGPDAEREVSLMSGREIAAALRGHDAFTVIEQIIDRPDVDALRTMIDEANADVVFPALHGQWGEGGPLQELLEVVGVPYVGSRPRAAALAMNKLATKTMLAADDVPTPPARQVEPDGELDLDPPLVLKPIDDGSSVDLRICHAQDEIDRARRELHPKRGTLLAERYIHGREMTVGILCDEALPLIEIIPAVDFYDYEAKYTRDDTQYVIDPACDPSLKRRMIDTAMLAYNRLGCRDVARVDFMVDDDGAWFLELNTMPGFTSHSLVPKAAAATGRHMPTICRELITAAINRSQRTTHQ